MEIDVFVLPAREVIGGNGVVDGANGALHSRPLAAAFISSRPFASPGIHSINSDIKSELYFVHPWETAKLSSSPF